MGKGCQLCAQTPSDVVVMLVAVVWKTMNRIQVQAGTVGMCAACAVRSLPGPTT